MTERDERPALSPTTQAILMLIQGLLPAMTAIVGGLWIVFTYLENQKIVEQQRSDQLRQQWRAQLIEARKPFLERQLKVYFDAANAIGKLVVGMQTPEWDKAHDRFQELYWSDVVLVESKDVKTWIGFLQGHATVHREKRSDITAKIVKESAQKAVATIREDIESSWRGRD
jgi:hypothetical protein